MLASICMVLFASLSAVLLYVVLAIRCDTEQHTPKYCFRLTATCAPHLMQIMLQCL